MCTVFQKLFKSHIRHASFLLIFGLTQLLAVGESLLCDYLMVVEYILEIDLTKRTAYLIMVLFTFNGHIFIKIDVGLTKGKGYLLRYLSTF